MLRLVRLVRVGRGAGIHITVLRAAVFVVQVIDSCITTYFCLFPRGLVWCIPGLS